MANTLLRTVNDTTLVHDCLILLREILRNNVTDPLSRGTSTTGSFTGNGTTTQFTLTEQPLNATAVTVAGDSKTMGVDYTITYETKVVTFATAPADGAAIVVTYRYATGNKSLVYLAFPDTTAAYPQIVLSQEGQGDEWMAIASDAKEVTVNIGITILSKSTKQRDELWDSCYDALRQQKSVLERNGISDLVVVRALNIPTEGDKMADVHQKSCEISFHAYATS